MVVISGSLIMFQAIVVSYDEKAIVMLTRKVHDITQPIGWARTAGNSEVFYTSLGHLSHFEVPV
jgi:type 1 glutamine amidotransferase